MKCISSLFQIAFSVIVLSSLMGCGAREVDDAEVEATLIYTDDVATGTVYESFNYSLEIRETEKRCDVGGVRTTVRLIFCEGFDPNAEDNDEDTIATCQKLDSQEIGEIGRGSAKHENFTVQVNSRVESVDLLEVDWGSLGSCEETNSSERVCDIPLIFVLLGECA